MRGGPNLARGRISEYKPNMNVVYDKNASPQVGALNRGVNPTDDSNRVQAPVVGTGSTDFGGSHKNYATNDTYAIAEENENSSDARMESEDIATTPTEYSAPGKTSREQRRRKMSC